MVLYPDNMTYEEMMEELAKLVARMIITYDPDAIEADKKIPKRTKNVKNIDNNPVQSDSIHEGLTYDI